MRRLCVGGWMAAALLAAGHARAATTASDAAPQPTQVMQAVMPAWLWRIDPWERFNRQMFSFNEAVDEAVARPVATAYQAVLPAPVRQSVGNFFANVLDVWSVANHLLQGKPQSGAEMAVRVVTNTVLGIAGLFDPATGLGLERKPEDFGQTLGRWGFGPGPYVVLPILGPSSLRDTIGLPVDYAAAFHILGVDGRTSYVLSGLELINTRANLLAAGRLLDQVALEKYSFVRDAYLSRRKGLVYDGEPPEDPEEPEEPDPKLPAAPAAEPDPKLPTAPAAEPDPK